MSNEASNLRRMMQERKEAPASWSEPDHYNLAESTDRRELERRMATGAVSRVIDPIDYIADDMFEMEYPSRIADISARAEYVADIKGQGDVYGTWVHYGWNDTLVRFPAQQDYYDLITYRNDPLIRRSEQATLGKATTLTGGMSVGSNINDQLIQSGIGGTQITGDYDILTPTNLNRIRSDMTQVGMKKIDVQARKTSLFNPYVKQIHLREGVNQSNLDELGATPDIIYDAVDDLSVKAMLRMFARDHKIPLVMATDLGDVSIIDVERYDTDNVEPFNGRVSGKDMTLLEEGELSEKDKKRLLLKVVGVGRLTTRLLDASMQIGETIGGLPQLGATASTGGSLAVFATREILLGRRMETGRYVSSPKDILRMQSSSTPRESLTVTSRFVAGMLTDRSKK